MDIVKRHAVEADAQRVLRIHLVVGELSSIVDDSVQFYFDYLSQNTIIAGAELCFQRLPVEVVCGVCEHHWHPDSADWTCPACGAARARVAVGREFYIESIEVE